MSRHASFWIEPDPVPPRPPLEENLSVDVAVVGAGIVGLTAAERLVGAGASVAVLEGDAVACGVSGHTTAKVTALHGLSYARIARVHDEERAAGHARAQTEAIAEVSAIAGRNAIDCDLRPAAAHTYAEDDEQAARVEEEAETLRRLGLDARVHRDGPLAAAHGAVALDGQARFQPYAYLTGLAGAVARGGAAVHEHTRVIDIDHGQATRLVTRGGAEVTAGRVILATHMPISDRGLFFARVKPRRAYALAMAADGIVPEGMYINVAGNRSVRPASRDGRDLLIVAGAGHPVGESAEPEANWAALEAWAREALGAGETLYRWSTQDNDPLDHLPLIGAMGTGDDALLGATGFGGWGMASGTLAGMILADMALGRENPHADVYDPGRMPLRSVAEYMRKGGHDAKELVGGHVLGAPGDGDLDTLPRGEGRVVDAGSDRIAVHRDADGALHAVDADCTHLGCVVAWNRAEQSWDCPCHGSRFGPGGEVLHGPAVTPLAPRDDALPAPPGERSTGAFGQTS